MQLRRHDVAPEVGLAVVAVAAEAQQQQLAAGGDDGGHPVRVRAAPVGHLQLHAGLEAALQAGLHLGENTCLLLFQVIPGAIKAHRSKQRCRDQRQNDGREPPTVRKTGGKIKGGKIKGST